MSVLSIRFFQQTKAGKFTSGKGMKEMSYRVLDQQLRPFYTWILADFEGTVMYVLA